MSKRPVDLPPTPSDETATHILVVDDEPSILQVVGRVLGHRGYKVTLAACVDLAIKYLGEQTFSLIVSDHKMPQKSGEDLFHFVRDHHPELIEKFILITGSAMDPSTIRFIEECNINVIEKPFDLSNLTEQVELLLNR